MMSSAARLRRSAASRRPNSNISSAAGFENGRCAVRLVGLDRVLGVLVAEQPVAELDDLAALVLRHAEDLGEHLHRDLRGDLVHEVELALRQRPVEHLARDRADLVLPDAAPRAA